MCVCYPAGLESATGWSCMVSSPSLVKAAPAAEKISPTCGTHTHTSIRTEPAAGFTSLTPTPLNTAHSLHDQKYVDTWRISHMLMIMKPWTFRFPPDVGIWICPCSDTDVGLKRSGSLSAPGHEVRARHSCWNKKGLNTKPDLRLYSGVLQVQCVRYGAFIFKIRQTI